MAEYKTHGRRTVNDVPPAESFGLVMMMAMVAIRQAEATGRPVDGIVAGSARIHVERCRKLLAALGLGIDDGWLDDHPPAARYYGDGPPTTADMFGRRQAPDVDDDGHN